MVNISVPVPEKLFPGIANVAVKAVMGELDQTFNKLYHKDFTYLADQCRDSKLQLKKSPNELKKDKREIYSKVSFLHTYSFSSYKLCKYMHSRFPSNWKEGSRNSM